MLPAYVHALCFTPVNIILFDLPETRRPLPRTDLRAVHILDVLRRSPGDDFDAGLIDGPRGKARLVSVQDASLTLSFAWGEEPPSLQPITLIAGMPRPQTARKVLQEATSLGVGAIHFVTCEKTEAGYSRSLLWSSGEWRRHLIAGAQQAFCTRLPALTHDLSLRAAIAAPPPATCRLALDNYEASQPLSQAAVRLPAAIAIGPERGWSDGDRDLLRESGFQLVHLGRRVLRSETACVAAITLVKAKLGLL